MVVLSARIEDPHIEQSLQRKLRRRKVTWRIIWIALLILMLGAGVYAYLRFAAYGRVKAAALLEEGKQAEQQFELTQAVEFYEQALALRSVARAPAAEAAYRAGKIFERKGDHGGGQSYLEQAERLDSSNTTYLSALGQSYLASRQLDKAEAAFDRALARDSSFADALFGKASLAYARQQGMLGDDRISDTLKASSKHAEARLVQAIRAIHKEPSKSGRTFDDLLTADQLGVQETARALKPLAEQLAGKPDNPAYEFTLVGAGLLERNEFDLALLELSAATDEDDEYRDAWVNRALAEVLLKQYDAAGDSLEKAVRLDPSFGFSRYVEGLLAEATDDLDLARERYELALEQRYQEPQVYVALAKLLDTTGERQEAIALLAAALKDGVKSEQLYDTLFWLYVDVEQYDEALELARNFRKFNDRSTTAEGMVAFGYLKTDEEEKARQTASSLLARDPLSAIGTLVLGLLDDNFDLLRKARDLDFGGKVRDLADQVLRSGI
ncbi:MAG: tetratricopeptide repeat protein [Parcubacteria group bacterium]